MVAFHTRLSNDNLVSLDNEESWGVWKQIVLTVFSKYLLTEWIEFQPARIILCKCIDLRLTIVIQIM